MTNYKNSTGVSGFELVLDEPLQAGFVERLEQIYFACVSDNIWVLAQAIAQQHELSEQTLKGFIEAAAARHEQKIKAFRLISSKRGTTLAQQHGQPNTEWSVISECQHGMIAVLLVEGRRTQRKGYFPFS